MSLEAAEKAVAKGIKFLEDAVGTNWPEFIDLDELRMESPDHCVLGEIFNNAETEYFDATNWDGSKRPGYWLAVDSVVDGDGAARELGFQNSYFSNEPRTTYDELNAVWREVIDGYYYFSEEEDCAIED